MFRDKEDAAQVNYRVNDNTTVLKEDASFQGKLTFEGNVLINGKFSGEIFSSGELTVGSKGTVEGTVDIGTIVIHGEVNGNIKASHKIVINAPAVVRGDIMAPSLTIEDGAVFEGNCSMGKASARVAKIAANDDSRQYSKSSDTLEFEM